MVKLSLLAAFIPTFFFVSATPGMCMMLSMSLGMTLGVKRTLWMMLGELAGVGLAATLSVLGVAAIMLNYPQIFIALKYAGGLYLAYLGVELWQSRGKMAVVEGYDTSGCHPTGLMLQGFITAVANPKGWAFFIALLPPFIDVRSPLWQQLLVLVSIILLIEFTCLLGYAAGGKVLRQFLHQGNHLTTLNRIAGTLMLLVSGWLVLG